MANFSGVPFQQGRVNALTAGHVRKISKQQLDAAGLTHVNYETGILNATLDDIRSANNDRVPAGLLAGSVVALKGNDTIGKHTTPTDAGTDLSDPIMTEVPLGLLAMDVAGDNLGGYFTTAGAPPTYYSLGGGDLLSVSLYETQPRKAVGQTDVGVHNAAASAFSYAAGDLVYVDMISGLLTLQCPVDSSSKTDIRVSTTQASKSSTGATPDVDYVPSGVNNGIWPFAVGVVVEVNYDGTSALLIRTMEGNS